MPNIREYTNPIEGLRPNEVGITARQQAGRHIGVFYRELGSEIGGSIRAAGDVAVDYLQKREISQGGPGYAGLFAKSTDAWNDVVAKADVNDPTVAQKFTDQYLEPELDKFRQGFLTEGGQKWAETRIQHLRDHFTTKMVADLTERAGQAVKVNMEQTANTLANSVYKDPTGVKAAMDALKSSFEAMAENNPNLKGTLGTKMKTEYLQTAMDKLVNTAALGAITKANDPEAAMKRFLDDPELAKYIKPAENLKWAHEVKAQTRLQATERRLNEAEDRRKQDEDFYNKTNDLVLNTFKQDAEGNITSQLPPNYREIVNELRLHPSAGRHSATINALVQRGRQLGKELDEDSTKNLEQASRVNMPELYARMNLPIDDPNRINSREELRQAYVDKKISWPALKELEKAFAEDRSEDGTPRAKARTEFINRFTRTIDGALSRYGVASSLGNQKVYEASLALRAEEQRLGPNWYKLYTPGSAEYFGRPENIMRYRITAQDATNYEASLLKAKTEAKPKPASSNLTGDGNTITGVEVTNAPPKPPKDFPDAKPAADGNWYVQRDGKWFKVKQ